MAFKPTEEQARIIGARNTSLLVSAAAGSGKTAVLVERIVSLVCDKDDPVDIDRILVVTFTQAAAAEMKERVLKRIGEILEDDPENEHLLKQQTLVHRALITTIDSFCLDVIRNHFQDIGIEPDFRVIDDGEAELIRADVLGKVLERAYEDKDPAFIKCVETFCPGNDDKTLEEIIMGLYRNSESFPWPEEYLLARKQDHDIEVPEDLNATPIEAAVMESSYGFIMYALWYIESALRLCDVNPIMDNYAETFSLDRDFFEALETCVSLGTLTDMYNLMSDLKSKKTTLKRLRKPANDEETRAKDELTEPAKAYREEAWKQIEKLYKFYYSFPIEEQVRIIRGCSEPVGALIDLVIEFRRQYAAEKKKRHSVDFSDLSHFALDILTTHTIKNGVTDIEPTDAATEYRSRFAQVMVDEYQDSNVVQEFILTAVSAENIGRYDRFTVGDVKQSIYSFRQAMPELFLQKQYEYDLIPPRMEIDLTGNFRSRKEVLDSVNRVFERIMHTENGRIEYDENAQLQAKAVFPESEGCKTELIIYDNKMIEKSADVMADSYNDADGEGSEYTASAEDLMDDASDKSELEARIIGTRIRELMTGMKLSDGNREDPKLRDISYRDIVILCRSVSTVTETYRKVFADMGIPLYAEGKNGYFKAAEVSLLLQYLRVLSNPLDDVPLYAVMHSVFGGFDENEIALIRAGRKDCSFYEALKKAAGRSEEADTGNEISSALKDKLSAFLDRLDMYRDMSSYLTVRQLLDRVTADHHYIEICSALPGGQSRTGNVRMLLVMASNYERSSYLGLNDFIRYIDNMEKFEVDSGEVGSASESADVVRLMTIHKSKGLEFPVVFLAGMGKGFNFKDVYKPLLADNMLGLACRYADTEKRVRMRTLRYSAISDKKRRDVIAEEMRLLYVAMTRPKEKLIMVGGIKDAEDTLAECFEYPMQRLPFGNFQSSEKYLDLILPVIGCEEVKEVIDIKIASAENIMAAGKKEEESQAAGVSEFTLASGGDLSYADKDVLDALAEKFSYEYPYKYLEDLYTKTTVSELKMAAMAEKDEGAYDLMEHGEDETAVPVFAGGSSNPVYDDPEEETADRRSPGGKKLIISGTERGNAYHRCMQLLSWDRILGPVIGKAPVSYDEYLNAISGNEAGVIESFEKFWSEELAVGHISEKTHAAVAAFKILTFLRSELSYRMWRAEGSGLLRREQPFVYGIDASRLLDPEHKKEGSEALAGEILMIQGIIDAYFEEDGKIILLDYKTDAVSSMEELWKRYETQMDYYREALESLTHLPVSERRLWSFKLGQDKDYGI
ncbi:MAG: helicase-exonuclease AddAB subunit AddA [Lachnospiraceae bacterium]|nr:helicase-exonuclease AddAB subunit AddA [Lachnospiraceae bacterium]